MNARASNRTGCRGLENEVCRSQGFGAGEFDLEVGAAVAIDVAFSSTVPLAVPSLIQSSAPLVPLSAENRMCRTMAITCERKVHFRERLCCWTHLRWSWGNGIAIKNMYKD